MKKRQSILLSVYSKFPISEIRTMEEWINILGLCTAVNTTSGFELGEIWELIQRLG